MFVSYGFVLVKRVVFPLLPKGRIPERHVKTSDPILCWFFFAQRDTGSDYGWSGGQFEMHHNGRTELKQRLKSGKPEIIALHEHLFVMSPDLSRLLCLQSPHPDGRVLAGASRLFGLRPIWGQQQQKCPVRPAPDGRIPGRPSAVITPDGPRGPARQMSMGPVSLAQLTGAQIVFGRLVSTLRCWRAKAGIKCAFPNPFSPIICSLVRP